MTKWIGTISGITGAVLVALNNGLQYLGYVAFLIGAIAWLIASVKTKDNAGIAQWTVFTVINIIGRVNYIS